MSPIGTQHSSIIAALNAWSMRGASADRVAVRIQCPVQFDAIESVPEPDVVWARSGDYYHRHPDSEDIHLVIEVSGSSLAYDRGEKAKLYAEVGISEYWIVNIKERVIEVHRDPAGGRYRQMQTFTVNDTISPLAFPDVQLAVAALWPS